MTSLITSNKSGIYRLQFFKAGLALQNALAEQDHLKLGWALVNAMSDVNSDEMTSGGWYQVIQIIFPELDNKKKVLTEILSSTPEGAKAFSGLKHLEKLVSWLKI